MDFADVFVKQRLPKDYVTYPPQKDPSLEQFFQERTTRPVAQMSPVVRSAPLVPPSPVVSKADEPISEEKKDAIKSVFNLNTAPIVEEQYSMSEQERNQRPSITPKNEVAPQQPIMQIPDLTTTSYEKTTVPDMNPESISDQAEKMLPKRNWMDMLPYLVPLAVGALSGDTFGSSSGIAGEQLLKGEGERVKRKQSLEDKLMEMQKSRETASIKAGKGSDKPLTSSNVLPIVGEDGKIRYEMVKEAVGKEKPTDTKGLTPEEWNRRQNYTYRLKSGLQKDKLTAAEQKDNRDLEVKLSKEWSSDEFTKGTRKVADAYRRISQIDPNNTDRIEEMGAIFDLMKSLDPQSVVRESEQAMAIGARSYSDVINYFDSILSGESKLTPTQIKNIKKFSENLYKKRMESQKDLNMGYSERARRYSLNSENIVQPISSMPTPQGLLQEGTIIEQGNNKFKVGKNQELIYVP